jgi:hypothetical protein
MTLLTFSTKELSAVCRSRLNPTTELTSKPVLVPNDQALAAFGDENPDLSNDTDAVRALLEYHIANGTHPSATFGLQPLFVPTLLTNPDYTNVTGGQVVEFASLDNRSAVVSGVKAVSHLVEAVSVATARAPQRRY